MTSIFTTKPLLLGVINEYLDDVHDGWVAFMYDNDISTIHVNSTCRSSTPQLLIVRTDVRMLEKQIIYTNVGKWTTGVLYNPYTEETILQQITEHINKCNSDGNLE